ncbi:nuclear receptor-interacting protein 2 isoform X1 [Oryzias latipes]|uniref:Nuclear receptor interacting protein 2 n=1 Tax=Oryzias latipes TaxID=8090 RepID=H2MPN7_ORYLA|nr:nuclear receptor-interacting protein 2 isoform X1 [Oryzias latipes]
MSEAKKGELAIRDKAILHQQRRLKQATQFTHKDSADLLPLDGLKRLGTSKDLQPHSIVQRRLLEGNITRLRGEARDPSSRVRSPLADTKDGGPVDAEERSESTAEDSTEERESLEESEKSLRSDEEDDSSEAGARQTTAQKPESPDCPPPLKALIIHCKCCETEVKASINTSSPHNHISTSCCRRLGLVASEDGSPCGVGSSVTALQLQVGRQTLRCSAFVKEDEAFELCLGLQTLLDLKCCLDLSSRVLKFHGCDEELPFLNTWSDSRCQHDTNENL